MRRSIVAADRDVTVRVAPAETQPFPLIPSIGEYLAYDDQAYGLFAAAAGRNSAYRAALAQACAGGIVVDIGTGRDALWAVEAARAGARRVYAIEELPEVAALARCAVARAEVGDVVRVVEGRSTDVVLPERVDVCVSEIVGNIASAEGAVAVLADAQRRWAAPGCTFIPHRCRTRIAAVSLCGQVIAEEAVPYLDRVFGTVGRAFDPRICVGGPARETIISSVGTAEDLAVERVPTRTEAELTVNGADAPLTGFLLWPEVQCGYGQEVLDGLDPSERSWAPVLAPVAPRGVAPQPGDRVRVGFHRTPSDDRLHPDYRLTADLNRHGDWHPLGEWRSAHHCQGYRESDFYRWLFPLGEPGAAESAASLTFAADTPACGRAFTVHPGSIARR